MYQNSPQFGSLRNGLSKPLIEKMEEALSIERALLKVLPSFAKAAFSRELTSTFDLYAAQSEDHVRRLKRISAMSEGTQLPAVWNNLLIQACKILEDCPEQSAKTDATLIRATSKIVYNQIRLYDCLYGMAAEGDFYEIAGAVKNIIDCENERHRILSMLASNCKKEVENV